jgi:hypothetical protein
MGQPLRYRLGRFLLTVNSACYLIEVRECDRTDLDREPSDLPSWIFESKHAIWLTDENKPIFERAKHGEKIKKQFLAEKLPLTG